MKGFKCVRILTNDAKEHLLRAEVSIFLYSQAVGYKTEVKSVLGEL